MILLEDVLRIHEFSINDFGGSRGVRDTGLLESAIARPFQTFGGEDLYPSPFAKAVAVAESLIINHPFVDGNKRTGVIVMVAVLKEFNFHINADSDSLYQMAISISTGEIRLTRLLNGYGQIFRMPSTAIFPSCDQSLYIMQQIFPPQILLLLSL